MLGILLQSHGRRATGAHVAFNRTNRSSVLRVLEPFARRSPARAPRLRGRSHEQNRLPCKDRQGRPTMRPTASRCRLGACARARARESARAQTWWRCVLGHVLTHLVPVPGLCPVPRRRPLRARGYRHGGSSVKPGCCRRVCTAMSPEPGPGGGAHPRIKTRTQAFFSRGSGQSRRFRSVFVCKLAKILKSQCPSRILYTKLARALTFQNFC
jgi:hypothetical protein